jgi:hypothetical protein
VARRVLPVALLVLEAFVAAAPVALAQVNDRDGDGVACEANPAPFDLAPVAVSAGPDAAPPGRWR